MSVADAATVPREAPPWAGESKTRVDYLPYGGVGDPRRGREGPAAAVEEITELRQVVLAPGDGGGRR